MARALSFLLFLLLQVTTVFCTIKMILFDGTVTQGLFPLPYSPPENCVQSCFEREDCLLAWEISNGSCAHYSYLNRPKDVIVTRTGYPDGDYVAIKSHIPDDMCPKSFLDMDLYMTTPWNDTYSWAQTDEGWNLNGCRDEWTRFERDQGTTVCLKAFRWPVNKNKADSKTLCMIMQANLTGIASVEESQWAHDELAKQNPTGSWTAFWVDGIVTCTDGTCDLTTLTFSDGYTKATENGALASTNNFHIISSINTTIKSLAVAWLWDRKPKTMYTAKSSDGALGGVCGYELRDTI